MVTAWDFGDGTKSTAQNPSHTYSTAGGYTVTLTASNGSGNDTVTRANLITVNAAAGKVLYRINTGGGSISGTPAWGTDSYAAPPKYENAAASGSSTIGTTNAITMTDPSIPTGTPKGLFTSQRYDAPTGAEMQWAFPVPAGRYVVRLYFAEISSSKQAVGARVFNVAIEGAPVLTNYDVYKDVGGYKAVAKTFTVQSDGTLNIDFGHVVKDPAVAAIEILAG